MSNRNRRRKNNSNKQAKPVVQILSDDAVKDLLETPEQKSIVKPESAVTEEVPEPDAEQMLLLQEADPEAEPDTEADPETDSEPEIDAEPEADPEPEIEVEPVAESEPEAEEAAKTEQEEPGETSVEELSDQPVSFEAVKDEEASQGAGIPEVPDLKIENVPQFYIDDDEEEEEEKEEKKEEEKKPVREPEDESEEDRKKEVRRPRRKPRQEIEVRPEPKRREGKRTGPPPRRKPEKKKPQSIEKPQKIRQVKRETGKVGNKRFNILFVTEGTQRVRTIRTTTDTVILVNVIATALIIAVIAYIIHAGVVREEHAKKLEAQEEYMTTLSEDAIILQAEIERLENELKTAQDKISAKENRAQAKTEAEALLYIPSALPVDSQALPSEYDRKNKWITIDAAPGVHVVAAGDGTVEYAGESVEAGGYLVTVDHGNGYKSNYYCQSKPVVKKGDKVSRGTALIAIGDTADKLIYRIIYEDDFIDPYTVLNISG